MRDGRPAVYTFRVLIDTGANVAILKSAVWTLLGYDGAELRRAAAANKVRGVSVPGGTTGGYGYIPCGETCLVLDPDNPGASAAIAPYRLAKSEDAPRGVYDAIIPLYCLKELGSVIDTEANTYSYRSKEGSRCTHSMTSMDLTIADAETVLGSMAACMVDAQQPEHQEHHTARSFSHGHLWRI